MTDERETPDPERIDLSALHADAPPSDQEARVRAALRVRGEFVAGGRWWRRAVAAAVVFGAGLAAGVAWDGAHEGGNAPAPAALEARPSSGEPAWALVLLGGPDYAEPRTAAEEDRRVTALAGWARELVDAGRLVLAEELGHPVNVLPPSGLRPSPGAAVADPGSVALGIFLVRAPDAGSAVEIARGSPHLAHGGRVAVQPIVPH